VNFQDYLNKLTNFWEKIKTGQRADFWPTGHNTMHGPAAHPTLRPKGRKDSTDAVRPTAKMAWAARGHRHASTRSRRGHRARARRGGTGSGGEPANEVPVHRRSEHKGNVGSAPGKLTAVGTNRGGGASIRRQKWWTQCRFLTVEDRWWAAVSEERSCSLRE
jgi:hypothetical protein